MGITPKKPKVTESTIDQLITHYLKQIDLINEVRGKDFITFNTDIQDIKEFKGKQWLICEIRRQNRLLGRSIKKTAHALLMSKARDEFGVFKKLDGRSVGLMYNEIIDTLNIEFPEASTSIACLRWYVVHMRQEASEQGLPWPDLPQLRPRAKNKK